MTGDTAMRELRALRAEATEGSPAARELDEAIDRVARARRRLAQQAIADRTLRNGPERFEVARDGDEVTIYPDGVSPGRLMVEWVTSDVAVDLEGVR